MVNDYAIDPESLDESRHFRFLLDSIGFQQGRLIFEIPDPVSWIKSAIYNINTNPSSDLSKKEMEIIMDHISKRGFSQKVSKNYNNSSWIDNAEEALSDDSIKGIISSASSPNSIPINMLSNANPAWKIDPDVLVPREPGHFLNALRPIINRSIRFKIIDPYFDIMEERFYKFLRICYNNCPNSRVKIEIHCDYQHCKSYGVPDFVKNWQDSLRRNVGNRANVNVEIVLWGELKDNLKIHDRYLLTNMGGVRIPTGVDLTGSRDESDISRLSHAIYSIIYSRFPSNGNNPRLRHINTIRL